MAVQDLPVFDQETIDHAVEYHGGDLCPGLATGIQAARLALREVGAHDSDNPLVVVAETSICAVDAIQALVGTTVGNRNLVVTDYGKNAYTFYRQSNGTAVRIAGRPIWGQEYQDLRNRVMAGTATAQEQASFDDVTHAEAHRILDADPEDLFTVTTVDTPAPATPRVDPWLECVTCGEPVMESRTRQLLGQTMCVPCFQSRTTEGHSTN